jgi:Fic family protein
VSDKGDNIMDNNLVKKVMTFKSGNFVFSAKYNVSELNNLIFKARVLYSAIADIPRLPEWSTYLEEELIRRSIFSTAAIEGNPLKEEDVGKIINQPDGEQKNNEATQAIINLTAVYKYIKTIEPMKDAIILGEDFIRESHRIITTGLHNADNLPGKYRNHIVKVGDSVHGGIYTPPKCLPDIEKLMKEFVQWINSKEMLESDSFIRAALAHFHLGLIHPFGNGNGRTIRIVEAMLLRTSGIKYVPTMLSNYYYRRIDDYYFAFSNTIKNSDHDMTPFLKFMLEGTIESLNEIKSNIYFRLRLLLLRDYCVFLRNQGIITQRQHDLASMLLEIIKPITLKNLSETSPYNTLYRNVTERTARRDIAKLLELKILFQKENGAYELNTNALD